MICTATHVKVKLAYDWLFCDRKSYNDIRLSLIALTVVYTSLNVTDTNRPVRGINDRQL